MPDRSKLQSDASQDVGPLPADLAPLNDEAADASPQDQAAHPDQHSSVRANAAFVAAERAQATDEEEAVHQYLRCAAAAEAAHEWYLVALACERVGEFLLDPKPPTDFERALRMFQRAAAAYERCGMFAEARKLSYRVSLVRLWSFQGVEMPWINRAELFVYWLLAGFGYRPLRVIAASSAVILFYGIIYWLIHGAFDPTTGQSAGLVDSLYFSGITFTTVGYGDLMPAPHARLVALTEGFLGAFLIGFFVVVLAHRLAKS